MAPDVKVEMGGITRSMRPGSQLRCSTLGPLLPTSLRCLSMLVSVRAAQMQVNGAFRFEQASETCAHPHDPCGFPSTPTVTPRTRLSCPASIPRFCRSLLRQHGHRCLPVSTGAMSTSISLSRASPLEPAHDPGRLGRIIAEMRAMVRRIFTILSHFGARALFVCLWLVLCRCGAMVARGTSDARPRQPCGAS